ncbi:hypothetical protein WAI78_21525, partial [Acinetobacter baumannii]
NLSAEAEELRKKINTLSAELQILKRGADLEQQIYRLEGRRDSLDQDVTRRNAQLDDLKNSMQQQARLIQNPSLLSEKAVEIATLR